MPLLDAWLRNSALALVFSALLLALIHAYRPEGTCLSGGIKDEQGNCLPEPDPTEKALTISVGACQSPDFVMMGPRLP